MTERLKAVIVTFEKNVRVDDAEPIMKAIEHIKGVLTVKPIVADINQDIAEERVRLEIGKKLMAVLYPERGGV
jgi:hypothetical protein